MTAAWRCPRGRFVIADGDDWTVTDRYRGAVRRFKSGLDARRWAAFARRYVERWGDINCEHPPELIDEPPRWLGDEASAYIRMPSYEAQLLPVANGADAGESSSDQDSLTEDMARARTLTPLGKLRQKAGFDRVEDLALALGKDQSLVYKWETGGAEPRDPGDRVRYAEALGITVRKLGGLIYELSVAKGGK